MGGQEAVGRGETGAEGVAVRPRRLEWRDTPISRSAASTERRLAVIYNVSITICVSMFSLKGPCVSL